MKRLLLFVLAVCLPACAAAAARRPGAPADQAALAGSVNAFACDLYGRLAGEPGNLFLSPYSVSSALAMTWAGARGETAAEMAAALELPPGWQTAPDEAHAAFDAFSGRLNAEGKPYAMAVANSLWGQKGYEFVPEFLGLLARHYGAGLEQVDFAKDTEGARKTINAWVEKKTKDRIKDLIPPGTLQALTRLVLVNAIYFKGTWESPFKKRATRAADFFAGAGRTVRAPTMRQTEHVRYAEAPDAQAVELPYKGGDLAMVILLPKEKGGLAALEKGLTAETLATRLEALEMENVAVSLPRFTMTWSSGLAKVLVPMGMARAFDGQKADFTGINAGKEPFWIAEVIHKAFVEVNEEGTEAAAATAVVALGGAAPAKPIEFRADHPFLFLIRDSASGTILFMGRVVDPTAKS
ncbi:MAG: serpin family protein [Planctomycetes bacterium]|nr:serpin family protein [Planctomycetota bacterium]